MALGKKLLCCVPATFALVFSGAPALAVNEYFPGWYVGLHGIGSKLSAVDDNHSETGLPETKGTWSYGYGVSVGVELPEAMGLLSGLHLEGEITRYRSYVDEIHNSRVFPVLVGGSQEQRNLDMMAFMANAYYHFPISGSLGAGRRGRSSLRFSPYIGGGIGWAEMELSTSTNFPNSSADETRVAAWQGMAGISGAQDAIGWRLGYRYFSPAEATFEDGQRGKHKLDISSHNVEMGIQYRF